MHAWHTEMVTVEDHQACITGTLCNISTCSFYDADGEIDEGALRDLLPPHQDGSHPEPLIGARGHMIKRMCFQIDMKDLTFKIFPFPHVV